MGTPGQLAGTRRHTRTAASHLHLRDAFAMKLERGPGRSPVVMKAQGGGQLASAHKTSSPRGTVLSRGSLTSSPSALSSSNVRSAGY